MSGWRDRAACAYVDPELWFPEKGGSARAAKRICGRCPVQLQCLTEALDNAEQWGIRGGLTPGERRQLRTGREQVAA